MSALKTCRVCGESIAAVAIRCPKCQSWQSRWAARWSPSSPQSVGYQILLTIIVMIAAFAAMRYFIFPGGRDFEQYGQSLQFSSHSLSFSKQRDRENLAVVGTIKNTSDVVWRDVYVEARFFSQRDELIDTISSRLY